MVTKVKITKLAAVDNPVLVTPKMEDYKPGEDNGNVSVPIEYTVEGTLIYPIEVGKRCMMTREKRNGVVVNGLFSTSPVTEINGNTFSTMNSKYIIEEL